MPNIFASAGRFLRVGAMRVSSGDPSPSGGNLMWEPETYLIWGSGNYLIWGT